MSSTSATSSSFSSSSVWTAQSDTQFAGAAPASAAPSLGASSAAVDMSLSTDDLPEINSMSAAAGSTASSTHSAAAQVIAPQSPGEASSFAGSVASPAAAPAPAAVEEKSEKPQVSAFSSAVRPEGCGERVWSTAQRVNSLADLFIPGGTGRVTFIRTS